MTPAPRRRAIDRRSFLRFGIGAGGAALGLSACSTDPPSGGEQPAGADGALRSLPDDDLLPTGLDQRRLVVIELDGGNDGLDTVVPYASSAYPRLRPQTGVDLASVHRLDDEIGLHPALTSVAALGPAIVEGVGIPDGDLSHFESARRWWQGDMTGTHADSTGVFGRLCDQLQIDEPVTGVSIGGRPSPALRSAKAVTLALEPSFGSGWLSDDHPWLVSARAGLHQLAEPGPGPASVAEARRNLGRGLDFLDVIDRLPEREAERYPGTDLGHRLAAASRLIDADLGVRVLYIRWGSFDTHDNHRGQHDELMRELDEALAAFVVDLDAMGQREATLVCTTSEFGRRPLENAGGTDHGTAAPMLVLGPVHDRRFGEYPSLTDLDDNGNLLVSVAVSDYLATLSEAWFGVPAADVIDGPALPIDGLIA